MKGLYQKYIITKTSGKPLAEGWEGIVLRIDGGRYVDACRAGVKAFAEAVKADNPDLCFDIGMKLLEYHEAEKLQRVIDKAEKLPKGSFLNP